jgi:hypothetical protein
MSFFFCSALGGYRAWSRRNQRREESFSGKTCFHGGCEQEHSGEYKVDPAGNTGCQINDQWPPSAVDDEESTALERESCDGMKTVLLQQLTNTREKERMRQRGTVSDEGDQ